VGRWRRGRARSLLGCRLRAAADGGGDVAAILLRTREKTKPAKIPNEVKPNPIFETGWKLDTLALAMQHYRPLREALGDPAKTESKQPDERSKNPSNLESSRLRKQSA
jgi:hypothetical protein